jgi:uncharacterized protein YehS (DUF1456 family)
MTNNDIMKKLRVALQLRDDQIVDILKLVDFTVSKAELGALFRNEDHPKLQSLRRSNLKEFFKRIGDSLTRTEEGVLSFGGEFSV